MSSTHQAHQPHVLAEAMSELSITDASALTKSFPSALQDSYTNRTNPAIYLSGTFQHSLLLLAAMFDYGAILSGSRALEFFVPGSACPESDWDFYVPAYDESVAGMINVLNICGVNWHVGGLEIEKDLWADGSVTVSRSVLLALSSWISAFQREEAVEYLGERLHMIATAFKLMLSSTKTKANNFTVILDADERISFVPTESVPEKEEIPYEDPLGRSFNILYGDISTAQGIQNVQLIIGSYYTSQKSYLSFIKDFYASHVQCFISGCFAGHMYYPLAGQKCAIKWQPKDSQNCDKVNRAIEKYKSRGFRFINPPKYKLKSRTFTDEESLLLDFRHIYLPAIQDYRHEHLQKMAHKKVAESSGDILGRDEWSDQAAQQRDGITLPAQPLFGIMVTENIQLPFGYCSQCSCLGG